MLGDEADPYSKVCVSSGAGVALSEETAKTEGRTALNGSYPEVEQWREHRKELLREAERTRIERQLRLARKRHESSLEDSRCGAWQVSVGRWVLRLEKVPVEER